MTLGLLDLSINKNCDKRDLRNYSILAHEKSSKLMKSYHVVF
jgi:hypothetical protein